MHCASADAHGFRYKVSYYCTPGCRENDSEKLTCSTCVTTLTRPACDGSVYLTPMMVTLALPLHLARTPKHQCTPLQFVPRACHPPGIACATHPTADGPMTTSTVCAVNIDSCANPHYTTHDVIQATPAHPQRASTSPHDSLSLPPLPPLNTQRGSAASTCSVP